MISTQFFNIIRFLEYNTGRRCKSDVFQQDKQVKQMPIKADLESKIFFVTHPW